MHVHTSSQCDHIGGNFATLAKSLKLMAIFWRVDFVLGKILNKFGPIVMMLCDKCSLLKMAKYLIHLVILKVALIRGQF